MNSEKLSKRLSRVAEFVVEYGADPIRLADIGSDHAYLPANLALNHQIQSAIAGEVVEGPYQSAVSEVVKQGLEDMIDVRFGDGLEVVRREDQINTVTICGMGGILIRDILQGGHTNLSDSHLLVLQPNMAEFQLREWLMSHNYEILDEDIIQEGKHYYEIIVAAQSDQQTQYSKEELFFGPINLRQSTVTFFGKWQEQLAKEKYIYESMSTSQAVEPARLKIQEDKINLIERKIQ